MTVRYHGSITYNQTFDIENRLVSVNKVGTGTTTFSYDAAGQRTKTTRSTGGTIYYPFPGYEEEVNGSTTTRRTTYSLAGQAVAVRVQVVGGSNTVYYLHSDHPSAWLRAGLGSTTALSSSAVGGGLVSGSTARYLPFGAWRTTPTQTLTDRGCSGLLLYLADACSQYADRPFPLHRAGDEQRRWRTTSRTCAYRRGRTLTTCSSSSMVGASSSRERFSFLKRLMKDSISVLPLAPSSE
jgi:YD repeat-containing protein